MIFSFLEYASGYFPKHIFLFSLLTKRATAFSTLLTLILYTTNTFSTTIRLYSQSIQKKYLQEKYLLYLCANFNKISKTDVKDNKIPKRA
jgi:hypothetical protein